MPEKSFPLEDTDYNAEDAQLWMSTRTSGVYSADTNLEVTAAGGMNISVDKGMAWLKITEFGGIAYGNTDPITFTLAQADGILSRIDRVVIRFDAAENEVKAHVKQGALASSPVAPPIEREEGVIFELALADIFVGHGVTSITQTNITDTRTDAELCGIMSDGVTNIPSAQEFEQIFNTIQMLDNRTQTAATTTQMGMMAAADKLKLDGLLPQTSNVVVGTVAGDSTANRNIMLGFTPRGVIYADSTGIMYNYVASGNVYYRGGIAVTGGNVTGSGSSPQIVLQIITDGFRINSAGSGTTAVHSNDSGIQYRYIAFR